MIADQVPTVPPSVRTATALRRAIGVCAAAAGLLLAGCTDSATPGAGSTPATPPPATSAAPTTAAARPSADPSLGKALLVDAEVAAFGLAQPTMRHSKVYPDGLDRCDDTPYGLGGPDFNETVGWALSSPATEVVHSVSRYPGDRAAKGMATLSGGWCPWRDGETGATHRHEVALPDLAQAEEKYAVCYVWAGLTWCNIALRRGDVISAVRIGWGPGSKLSLAAVPQLARTAADRITATGR